MEITGKITSILPKITIGTKKTEKQSIVVQETTNEEEYKNNSVCIDFFKDKIKKLESLTTGDIVTVQFNIKAREYNDRVFNWVSWRSVELVGTSNVEPQSEWDLPF